MQFHHAGRQFFFITIAIERHPKANPAPQGFGGAVAKQSHPAGVRGLQAPVRSPQSAPQGGLSRLVDERSRPALLPCGEIVKALLVAMHRCFPCATISDFVIMPDHVHFLLIVDYSQDSTFSPLWATHRLMDAAEILWALERGTDGGSAPEPPEADAALSQAITLARQNFGQLIVGNHAVLPQPIPTLQGFGGAAKNSPTPQEFGGEAKDSTTQQGFGGATKNSTIQQGVGGAAPVPTPQSAPQGPRWNRRCFIELSFDARQLKAIRRYIRLNPARALWKARHPDRFIRFANIRHPVLDPARRWDAMGNLTLLASPFLHHVRLTMRKTAEEHAAEIDGIMERAVRGLVPVSGFISPGEKELLRRLKAEPQARFIKTVPFSLPPRYDPSAEDSRELAADRLLILSGFPQGTPDSRENLRARCNIMNSLAAALCARAAEMA